MIRALKAWGPAAIWAGVLFLLSEISGVPRGSTFPYSDKVAHFALYGVLGVALGWGRTVHVGRLPHWLLLAVGWTYGALDEWHQSFVPTRSPEGWDFAVDVVGVAAGYALIVFLRRREEGTPDTARANVDSVSVNSDRRRRGR